MMEFTSKHNGPPPQVVPRAAGIIDRMVKTEEGRHKVYASIYHPLMNRLGYAAKQAGREPQIGKMIPEKDLWVLVGRTAEERLCSIGEAVVHLMDRAPDISQDPPHPFVLYLKTSEVVG